MSVYDFNHNEHVSSVNRSSIVSQAGNGRIFSNGLQTGNYQNSSSPYTINRPTMSTSITNHMDMSVQSTRPTSKIAMLVRQRRAMLEQISCFICKGYLIDATTVDECMDSFCKSCIVNYLRHNSSCPKCATPIQKTNPLGSIRSDKVLQDIVYKLVPGLYDNEMKRRRDFYKSLYGTSSDSDDTDDSSGSARYYNLTGERYGVVTHPKPFYKPTDNIDLSIEPQTRNDSSSIYYDNRRQSIVTCFTGNRQQNHNDPQDFSTVDSQQFKTYLRCPAKLTALQLKKFIAAKYNICKHDNIHLLYLNESLKDKYSLIDIAYIYDWRGIEHMKFYFIVERDISRIDELDSQQHHSRISNKVQTRQSVGTSTHTVKRVCIDPQPRFYEEPVARSTETNGTTNHGRSMRTRTSNASTTTSSPNKNASLPTPQSNLKLSIKTDQQKVQVVTSNGRILPKISYGQIRYIPYPNNIGQNIINQPSISKDASETRDLVLTGGTKVRSNANTPSSSGGVSSYSTPKINISLNTLRQEQVHEPQTYGDRSRNDDDFSRSKSVGVNQTNAKQLIPFVDKSCLHSVAPASATITRPTQSSLVTLASFTEARSNHVVAMSTSTAATISSSYSNMLSADSTNRPNFLKSDARVDSGQVLMRPNSQQAQSSPQLAFSIVTERGITIVRRMNGKPEEREASSSSITKQPTNSSMSRPLPIMPATSSAIASNQRTSSMASSQIGNKSPASISSSSTNNSATSSYTSAGFNHATSPRYNNKMKPVYTQMQIDPARVKTNHTNKKFGNTARH